MISPDIQRAFFVSAGVMILDYIARAMSWYWTVPWFDTIMHTLGGFLVVMLAVPFLKRVGMTLSVQTLVLSVIIVGVGWEVFELLNNITGVPPEQYWSDTIVDLIADLLGGLLAIAYLKTQR